MGTHFPSSGSLRLKLEVLPVFVCSCVFDICYVHLLMMQA